ncbi:MAG: class I SAM-dependent methyltransferase [Alphaproteobacteria bacterium]|nr:class I SAM-dependent methyltransferase [Alphaproteobacteria bacterium]
MAPERVERDRSTGRFRFGENWVSFAATVTEERLAEAERGLLRLFPGGEIEGSRFLDIGCGSGLSALAACRIGAAQVEAIDVDPQSVEAARGLLFRFAPQARWRVTQRDVFDLAPERDGRYDIVYSWGVLHHTGAMWPAIRKASALLAPGGHLAVALYRRTPLCFLWKREKRFYAAAGSTAQAILRAVYKSLYRLGLVATGRRPGRYIAEYKSARGMDWAHDVHDWLGGYPYQSAAPGDVVVFLNGLGLTLERVFEHPAAAAGLFGSHCDEYVACRPPPR